MARYEGNEMRGMMKADYSDIRMDKSRELNNTMSINYTKSEDEFGNRIHNLSARDDR